MPDTTRTRIFLGITCEYLFVSFAMIAGGFIFISQGFDLSWIVVLLGFVLLLTPKYVVFDKKNRRKRVYYSFMGIRIGRWTPFPEETEIWVAKNTFYRNTRGPLRRGVWGTSGYAYTFAVKLVFPGDEEDLELRMFKDYYKALQWMNTQAPRLELNAFDDFGEDVQASLTKRP